MEWIRVEDRLPEGFVRVIVCVRGEVRCAIWDKTRFNEDEYYNGSIQPKAVTHWMPLPEPPDEADGI